ncbi:MAG: PAS domain S-box protein [Porphyromonadaceae bacterium]|nr:MAG: PAS domain S-box protein [Porphyromonadaceae bacterium]
MEKVGVVTTYQAWKIVLPLLMLAILFSILMIYGWMKRKSGARPFYYNRFSNIVMIARRAVVDRMIDGLIVLDSKNHILDINSSAQKIFRISISKVAGQPAETVFQSYHDVLENLRYYSRKHQDLQIQVGSDVFYYLLDINPLFDKRGGVLGKMLVFHDITSLKLTEIKLIEAKVRAEQSDDLKSAFLANMSHEIRTPMNAIIGFSNLLNDEEVSNEERNEFIEHIKNSGHSLLQLIDDIIDISKLNAGQVVQENHRISITRLLAELFSYFNENLLESGKKDVQLLVTGIRENIDWSVMADGVKINRIMRLLLANAVKFTTSGFIEFGVKKESSDVLLFYVQDSGIGIAHEKQGMVFERFSRVITGTQQEYGGTGMGLAICKGLTELMGGQVRVESSLGVGSTFFVSLPVSQLEEHPISESLLDIYGRQASAIPIPPPEIPVEPGLISELSETGELPPPDNWNSKVILVIEPEEMGYLNIEMILRQTRVNLFWAKSMKEALNYLDRNNPVDSIIASAQLDDSTVEDSINLLTSRLPQIPIIAIIPFEGSSLDKICRDLGCLTTIPKPIKPASLLSVLNPYMS